MRGGGHCKFKGGVLAVARLGQSLCVAPDPLKRESSRFQFIFVGKRRGLELGALPFGYWMLPGGAGVVSNAQNIQHVRMTLTIPI
jgi:hypothetical protein